MNSVEEIFGAGRNLNALQMTCRAIIVFLIALILLRISGRRSFGLHTPLDNIITIILGAILSRAVVGASDFFPVIASCTAIVIIHRLFAYGMVHHRGFSKLIAGEKILLFNKGNFIEPNMRKAQVCEEDILEELRKKALTENLDQIDKIYIERNGEVNSVKKQAG
jgi:uncharacterized membrane protein YcaP (DUF421 family)